MPKTVLSLEEERKRILKKRVAQKFRDHKKWAKAAGYANGPEYDLAGLLRFVDDYLSAPGPRCAYCPVVLYEVNFSLDHRVPLARGGRHALANLALACLKCNKLKGKLTDEEFGQLMAVLRTWHPAAGHDVLTRLQAGWRKGWRA